MSDPDIPAMGEVTDFDVRVFGEAVSVKLGGSDVAFTVSDGYTYFDVDRSAHESGNVSYEIRF